MITQLKDTFQDIWTYHNYKADSNKEAKEFLNSITHDKSKEIYYVETPTDEFWV